LQTRYTVEPLKRYFDTNDRPVLVTCDDLEDYVCKYRNINSLVKEYLAASFLQIWQIPTPEPCFIRVRRDHVTEKFWSVTDGFTWFERDCFGSAYLEQSVEVGGWLVALGNDRAAVDKIKHQSDFLKIGLFDLWLGNDDRNHNNYNLLLVPEQVNRFRLYAIDHSGCFNGMQAGERALSLQAEDENVLTSPLCQLLYGQNPNRKQAIETVLADFYPAVQRCRDSLPEILSVVPPSWPINAPDMLRKLDNTVFISDWPRQVERTFREFLHATFG
jgi:hypothetical protein